MCDIVCDNIVIVVLTMCDLTLSVFSQKPNKTLLQSAVKSSAHAFRVCSFTAVIQSVKMHLKWSQNWRYRGRKCIFVSFHIVNQCHMKSAVFLQKSAWLHIYIYIFFFYNSSINKELRDLPFRHHIACFCSISTTKIISNTATALFCVSEQHDCFIPEWINHLNDRI